MIRLRNITKTYRMKAGRRLILDNLSVDFVPGINAIILLSNQLFCISLQLHLNEF